MSTIRIALRTAVALGLGLVCLVCLVGCRPDAGSPTYSDRDDFSMPFGFSEPLEGPDPYQEGLARLSFGAFYEGGSSQTIVIDDQIVHYYIFLAGDDLTYTQSSSDDRIEGLASDRIAHAGGAWWGGGIISDTTADLGSWTQLHISLKSAAGSFESMTIGMRSPSGDAVVSASDYGFVADSEWHNLSIPMIDLIDAGLDISAVDGFLLLAGGSGDAGDAVLVDNFYLSQQP